VGVVEAFERLVDEVLALAVVLAAIAMLFTGVSIPEWFRGIVLLVVGYYFRAAVEAHRGRGGGGS